MRPCFKPYEKDMSSCGYDLRSKHSLKFAYAVTILIFGKDREHVSRPYVFLEVCSEEDKRSREAQKSRNHAENEWPFREKKYLCVCRRKRLATSPDIYTRSERPLAGRRTSDDLGIFQAFWRDCPRRIYTAWNWMPLDSYSIFLPILTEQGTMSHWSTHSSFFLCPRQQRIPITSSHSQLGTCP